MPETREPSVLEIVTNSELFTGRIGERQVSKPLSAMVDVVDMVLLSVAEENLQE
jgi:hypothetical protein